MRSLESLELRHVRLANCGIARQRDEFVEKSLRHGGEEHRRMDHRDVVQSAVRHPEFQRHAARAFLGVGSFGISTCEREARDDLQDLAGEQRGARIGCGFAISDECPARAYAFGVVPALALMRAVSTLKRIDDLLGGGFGLLLGSFRTPPPTGFRGCALRGRGQGRRKHAAREIRSAVAMTSLLLRNILLAAIASSVRLIPHRAGHELRRPDADECTHSHSNGFIAIAVIGAALRKGAGSVERQGLAIARYKSLFESARTEASTAR